ncbi:hypothetical protein [Bradyrhizobium sp. th.b2]|uniref:hypothetical protein n=1 Tax=Bradyrhizobium sp. th-b2 TaxID=172088 RepID=UPI0013E208CC|nr:MULTISPECIES: hypothetical protein [unclassified Bradyrhizobium]QIG92053.1 hypothetical protein G6P99_05755 [Bradyrhizobium sp. 6(2017)]
MIDVLSGLPDELHDQVEAAIPDARERLDPRRGEDRGKRRQELFGVQRAIGFAPDRKHRHAADGVTA